MPTARDLTLRRGPLLAFLITWLALALWNSAKPLPRGTHIASQSMRLTESDVEFLSDSEQPRQILAREISTIGLAEQMIVVDQSPLARELAMGLLARKHARPNIKIVVVTDPANEAFGGTPAESLIALERAGVIVARVRLDRLRDSNPLYSGLWRLLFGWWSDPYDEAPGKFTLRAWARMQNHKADRRELMVADDGSGGWSSIVSSADAAISRAGAALLLHGALARDIAAGELAIAAWSSDDDRLPAPPSGIFRGLGSIDARLLTEGAIGGGLLDAIAAAQDGDEIRIALHVLGARRIMDALEAAAVRGAAVFVLLDANRLPNQASAGELERESGGRVRIRWRPATAAPMASKLLLLTHRRDIWLSLGSANFTRRELGDLDLEANVELRGPAGSAPARAALDHFTRAWASAIDYEKFADDSAALYWRYRMAEATGLGSF